MAGTRSATCKLISIDRRTTVSLLFFTLLVFTAIVQAQEPPIAVKGILDLRDWDFALHGSVEMRGEWAFYWKKFYEGDDLLLDQNTKPDAYLSVPNVWNGLTLADGTVIEGTGFATLRLKILLPQLITESSLKFLRINIRPIDSPFAIQVFDNTGEPLSELISSGALEKGTELTIPPKRAQDFPVRLDSELIIIWRISNHHYPAYAGPWRVPEIGEETTVINTLKINRSSDFILIGIALAAGLYHWILFLLRRKDYEVFWFGLFCLSIAFVVFYVNEYIGDFVDEESDYKNLQRSLVLFINLDIISLICFLRNIIPGYAKNNFSALLALPSIFFIFAVWVLPFNEMMFGFFTYFLPTHHALIILWASYVSFRAFLKKVDIISFFVFSGILALSITNIHAILVATQVVQDVLYLHFGLVVFIVMQAIAIARKNQDAYRLSEQLANDLKAKSTELERQTKELIRIDRLKDGFLANTSHELQTPLNGIIGLTETLLDQSKPRSRQHHHLSLIIYSAKRLYNLVRDILDFSKIQHQDIKLKLKPIDLGSHVDFVLATSKPLVKDKSIELRNHITSNIAPVLADEDRLQQVLFNLLSNAIKFTEQGEITVSAVREDSYIRVLIKDTGIGIPEQEHAHIFDAFGQATRPSADVYGGTGLGLTIVKQLVELHGGTVTVNNRVSSGTVFSFTLPVHSELNQARPDSLVTTNIRFIESDPDVYLPGKIASTDSQKQDKTTILIVDDESINVQLINEHLSTNHYTVLVARNGLAALELVKINKPDLVLMDLMMPIMNGFEATRKIRQYYSLTQLPIIILTIRSRLDDLIEGLDSGANDYLLKPFHKEELLARIRVHLNISRTKQVIEKFVPTDFFKYLEKESVLDIQLGDNVEKELSILFSDIRSFTSFAEQTTSEEVFSFINFYLSKMGPLVRKYDGFIHQYVGDAIVALFGNSPDDALQSAINMLSVLRTYNETLKGNEKKFPIKIGIGIHSGKLRLGIIGEQNRIQSGVIGDAINLASRLQDMTKIYEASLLISEDTFHSLINPEKYIIRAIGRVKVKGRKNLIEIFEVLDGENPVLRDAKKSIISLFEAGIKYYAQEDLQQAKTLFEECYKKCPQDKASFIYLSNCK